MGEFTISQVLLILSGTGGFIVVLIKAFTFIGQQLDARGKRKDDRERHRLEDSVEARRLVLDYSERGERNTITELWKLNDDKDEETKELKTEIRELENKLKDAEKAERLNRPTIMRIYTYVRGIRTELDSLNVMVLNEEETNVFMRRFRNVKELIGKIEDVLSGDS
jgi:uncharacterized protein YlxW (UPF0749 family)